MDGQRLAAHRLVEMARPFLDRGDRAGLAEALAGAWSSDCLVLLLDDDDPAVVEVAATALGCVADISVSPALARLLHHEDAAIADAAEDALWSVWFRDGGPMAQAVLTRIARSIKSREVDNVVPLLTELIRAYPRYAEAYHQRSQAHLLQNAYEPALRDARRAYDLNPFHFSALANQAHALAALGRWADALKVYRQVGGLHPRFPGIREAVHHLRRRLASTSHESVNA